MCREEEEGIKRGRGEGKRGRKEERGGGKAGVVETEALQISSNSHFDSALPQ